MQQRRPPQQHQASRALAGGGTGDAAGRRAWEPGVWRSWAGPRSGKNGGRGGADGLGPRSAVDLGRARLARNPAASQTWAETAGTKGPSPRSGRMPLPAPSGGPTLGYASWRRSGACHPPWSAEEIGYRWRKWRDSGQGCWQASGCSATPPCAGTPSDAPGRHRRWRRRGAGGREQWSMPRSRPSARGPSAQRPPEQTPTTMAIEDEVHTQKI